MVRVDWRLAGDPEFIWFGMGWEPTEEDYINKAGRRTRSYRGGEDGFSELSSSFIREGSVVYAEFSTMLSETTSLTHELEKRGFHFKSPRWRRDPVCAQVDRDFIARYFKTYGSWMSDSCTFLVSREPLADWEKLLRERSVTKELLTQIELLLRNRWEHGFEVLSCKLTYDRLLEMAKDSCAKLKWQLQEIDASKSPSTHSTEASRIHNRI